MKYAIVVSEFVSSPGRLDPMVALEYTADWTDISGVENAEIVAGADVVVMFGERLSEAQLTAMLADMRFAVMEHGEMTTDEPT